MIQIQIPPLQSGPLSQETTFSVQVIKVLSSFPPNPASAITLDHPAGKKGAKISLGNRAGRATQRQSFRVEGICSGSLREHKKEKDAPKARGGVLFFSETCCTVGLCLLFLAQIAVANYIAYQMWFVRLSKETTARTCFPCCLHPIMRSAQIRFLMLHRSKFETLWALFFL